MSETESVEAFVIRTGLFIEEAEVHPDLLENIWPLGYRLPEGYPIRLFYQEVGEVGKGELRAEIYTQAQVVYGLLFKYGVRDPFEVVKNVGRDHGPYRGAMLAAMRKFKALEGEVDELIERLAELNHYSRSLTDLLIRGRAGLKLSAEEQAEVMVLCSWVREMRIADRKAFRPGLNNDLVRTNSTRIPYDTYLKSPLLYGHRAMMMMTQELNRVHSALHVLQIGQADVLDQLTAATRLRGKTVGVDLDPRVIELLCVFAWNVECCEYKFQPEELAARFILPHARQHGSM